MQREPRTWLSDLRVLGAIGLAAAIGFTAGLLIFGQPWHLPPNYGDVPTWLAALFAAIAGWIGLSQLGMLRKQIADEAERNDKRDKLLDRQLEEAEARSAASRRTQAEGVKVKVSWDSPHCRLRVSNDSPRPITDITSRLVSKTTKTVAGTPAKGGIALRLGSSLVDPPNMDSVPDPRIKALGPDDCGVFTLIPQARAQTRFS
jgi:hypothetical protein